MQSNYFRGNFYEASEILNQFFMVLSPSSTVGEKKSFFYFFLRTFFGEWAVFGGVMMDRGLVFC